MLGREGESDRGAFVEGFGGGPAHEQGAGEVPGIESRRADEAPGVLGVEVRAHEVPHAPEHEVERGVGRERPELKLQLAELPQVVGVEERDEVAL